MEFDAIPLARRFGSLGRGRLLLGSRIGGMYLQLSQHKTSHQILSLGSFRVDASQIDPALLTSREGRGQAEQRARDVDGSCLL